MARSDDDRISMAVRDEELAVLRGLPDEPGYTSQILALFKGRTAWPNLAMMLAQGLLFIAGAGLAWRFFRADEPTAAPWAGLPAATLLLMSLIIKMAFLPTAPSWHCAIATSSPPRTAAAG